MEDDWVAGLMDPAELPTALTPTTNTHFIDVGKDRLTVKYIGKGNHSHDVGAIRANKLLPRRCMIAYFEVHILDIGQKGSISVGLAVGDFPLAKHPGLEANSYGLLGDSGKIFQDGNPRGEVYGVPFMRGDVIGCGSYYERQEVFFTSNGKFLGTAFRKVNGDYYATVGMHSPGESVRLNFGHRPFRFDLAGYLQEQQQQWMSAVQRIPLDIAAANTLVYDYLVHYGFEDTVHSFGLAPGSQKTLIKNATMENTKAAEETMQSGLSDSIKSNYATLAVRKRIRNHVLNGDMTSAIRIVSEEFPRIFDNQQLATNRRRDQRPSNSILFLCRCQEFIELVRHGEMDRCLDYAVNALGPFYTKENTNKPLFKSDSDYTSHFSAVSITHVDQNFLQDVVALLAYESPQTSPLRHLLSLEQREKVADALNSAILTFYSDKDMSVYNSLSHFEHTLLQLYVTQAQLREENGNRGAVFSLEAYIA